MYEKRVSGPSKVNLIGYLFLIVVILSGASFVPLGVALDVSNPMMKVSWRVMNMIPFLGLVGILQALKERDYKLRNIFNAENIKDLLIAAFCIAM